MSPAPHTPAEYEAMRAETEAALAHLRAGGAGLDVDLAGRLEWLELPYRLVCTTRFAHTLDATELLDPWAAVAMIALCYDPAALGLFPTTPAPAGRQQLQLPEGRTLTYRVVEGRWPTVELHDLT